MDVLARLLVAFFLLAGAEASAEIRKVATWNMKWLGTSSGKQLDPIETVDEYADIIVSTGATLLALQEIGATHTLDGEPRCHYLDEIANELIQRQEAYWKYVLDDTNKNQRLAFLYRTDHWQLSDYKTIYPGSSYQYIRRPFVASVDVVGSAVSFDFINVHFKAFPDSTEKRVDNIEELANWVESQQLDDDVIIAGDTNIYSSDGDIEGPLEDAGITPISDEEKTAVHNDQLSNRFDRFYLSAALNDEYQSASSSVGSDDVVDVVKEDTQSYLEWFDENISDHFPVVINLDF